MISPWELVLRLAVAAVLGALVGLERERLEWAAGMRTQALVSLRIGPVRIRYANFHTTALCSPPRSSLLKGLNATSNNGVHHRGLGRVPGFSARILFENGTIAEMLNERGWNTYAIG
jgi:MgtC family